MQLIECVPNISEGRDLGKIETLTQVLQNNPNIHLLNVDPGKAANRTVFTYIGEPSHMFEATKQLIAKAYELIDMSSQTGEHPRMGAVDVCPFIPVQGITITELKHEVDLFAKSIEEELSLPIYLYEQNSNDPNRKRLEQIRKGEYEGLKNKMTQPEWSPNYGSKTFNPKFGAMVMGARNFLLAYNINLETNDISIAKEIAGRIRESGYVKNSRRIPGLLKGVKAIGWHIADFNKTQVSTNITNFEEVGIVEVFERIKDLAKNYNTKVTGSELIGLLPFEAFKQVASDYDLPLKTSNDFNKIIEKLNLNEVKPFSIEEQILEYKGGLMQLP